ARSLLLGRKIFVEVPIERLALRNGGVVVPGEEFPRDDLVDTDCVHPEVDCGIELPLDRFLPNDRDDDPRWGRVLLAKREGGSNVCDLVVPPQLGIARRSTVGQPYL